MTAFMSEFFLSSSESAPMYSQIMEQILAKVVAGDWGPGHPLPSIRDLASASRVSVITVKRAYLELEHAGVIVTRQGKGSFVADTQELPRQLAQQEFDAHLNGLLGAANKLGMNAQEVLRLVSAALLSEPADAAPLTNTGNKR
jgi:GntR family transcriptional regulator